jgi:L-asparaginase
MMKKILLVYTGGTIGMVKKEDVLSPFNFDELKTAFPELKDCGSILDHVTISEPIDSSNMSIHVWIELANCIKKNYTKYDGFVILHGSDTMAYTASMLSFMLEGISKPVILTGSQLPIGIKRTDAKENLITSIEIAASNIVKEVCVYFEYQLYRGNRVVKVNADNFDAFQSPNYPVLAKAGVKIKYKKQYINNPIVSEINIHTNISDDVGILKLFPSIKKEVVKAVLDSSKGIILQTFGSGNATTNNWFIEELTNAIKKDKVIVNISQCLSGSVNQGHYQTSEVLQKIGVISGHDMTLEAALTKLMFLLGARLDRKEICKKIETNLRGEITI